MMHPGSDLLPMHTSLFRNNSAEASVLPLMQSLHTKLGAWDLRGGNGNNCILKLSKCIYKKWNKIDLTYVQYTHCTGEVNVTTALGQ